MEKKVIVTRIYQAPVELVWQTWTDPELVKRWWGPDRFTCPFADIDFRVGGRSLVSMKAPKEFGGQETFCIWVYSNIIPMQRIEFVQSLSDKDGRKVDPVSVGMPADFPREIPTVVSFKDLGSGKTEMTVTQYADFGQTTLFAKMGMEQSLDKMVAMFP